MRSMFAPAGAIRAAMPAIAAVRNGRPRTVTCRRPVRRGALSSVPEAVSTSIPSRAATGEVAAVDPRDVVAGQGVEQGRGDPRPIPSGDSHQQGSGLHQAGPTRAPLET